MDCRRTLRVLVAVGAFAGVVLGGPVASLWAQVQLGEGHISKPGTPTGPMKVMTGTLSEYVTTGSTDAEKHSLEYAFDWSDGASPVFGDAKQSHAWGIEGKKTVKVIARCSNGQVSDWSDTIEVDVVALRHSLAAPSQPVGPTSGAIGVVYDYKTSLPIQCSWGHSVGEACFDWGDTNASPYGSIYQSHSWSRSGFYSVRARARCSAGALSAFSKVRGVTISEQLVVSPNTSILGFWGAVGGPFQPAAHTCTLKNAGSLPIKWESSILNIVSEISPGVTSLKDWIEVSPPYGTLEPGEQIVVTLSVTDMAKSAPAGGGWARLILSNLTNGSGNTERYVTLAVGGLTVTPSDSLGFTMSEGGLASPTDRTLVLTNHGPNMIDWKATSAEDWITLSATYGTLDPSESISLRISVNDAAGSLPAGSFESPIIIENASYGIGNTTLAVSLEISPTEALPSDEATTASEGGGGGGGGCGMIGLDALLALGLVALYRRRNRKAA